VHTLATTRSSLTLLWQILLTRNAKVYIAARSQEKTEAAIKDLKDQTGKEAIWLKLDLSDLNTVKAAAEEFLTYGSSFTPEIPPIYITN